MGPRGTLTLLRIHLADISRLELLLCQLRLLLNPLLIPLSQTNQLHQPLLILVALGLEIIHQQCLGPNMLMQIHQHVFLEPRLPVRDADGVVVAVQAVDEGLNGGFVEMSDVGRRLAGFLARHEGLWVYEAEGIDDDFSFHGLDGVDDYGDGAGGELFEGLLRVDVDGGEPAAESGMRVVPAYYCFLSITFVCQLLLFPIYVVP